MERLTIEYCGEYVPKELCSIDRFGGADDFDLCCDYCKATEEGDEDCRGCAINKCFNKLGQYEELEKQGKLLKLPCKVGDYIYTISRGKIISLKVCEISIFYLNENNLTLQIECSENDSSDFLNYLDSEIGKTVFLTQEEVKAALKEM